MWSTLGSSVLKSTEFRGRRCKWILISKDLELSKLLFPHLLWRLCVKICSKPFSSVQFSSVGQSCPTLYDHIDCSMPAFPVHHQLLRFTQTHVHWVGDAKQPSHPLSSPSPPAFSLSQHQGLFQWVSSSHQVAEVLEFQLQHQSFQWTSRNDLL